MSDNYVQFSEAIELNHPGEVEWATRRLGLFKRVSESDDPESHPEYGAYEQMVEQYEVHDGDDPTIEFDWGLEPRGTDGLATLYIFSDESGNIDQAATFVQEYLLKFSPDKCFHMTWAETCSRSLVGEFGGGAVFITAKKIDWMSAHDWADKKRKAFTAAA